MKSPKRFDHYSEIQLYYISFILFVQEIKSYLVGWQIMYIIGLQFLE